MLKFYTKADFGISKKIVTLAVSALILSAFVGGLNAGTELLTKSAIEEKLFMLKPLAKVHYSSGLRNNLDNREDRILYEIARITHSVCVSAEWVNESQIENCVYACAKVNKTMPAIPSSIGINFSPWHRKFGKDLPPTDRGPTYYEEIAFFRERMGLTKDWVSKYNEKYNSDVKVSVLLLDCERFYEKHGDEKWNEAMREAVDTIHKIAGEIFPEARIEWYGRSMVKQGDLQWEKSPYFTGKEIMTTLSCSFYSVPELDFMREKLRKTTELADKFGIKEVTAYVALGAGFRRGLKKVYWDDNWDYDLIYSYMIGAELNNAWYARHTDAYAPYDRCKVVVFFPPPFYKDTPNWGKHFVAYVRGATGVKELSDLGFDK